MGILTKEGLKEQQPTQGKRVPPTSPVLRPRKPFSGRGGTAAVADRSPTGQQRTVSICTEAPAAWPGCPK